MNGGRQVPASEEGIDSMEQSGIDHVIIKRYLLGDLAEDQQERIEKRMLIDREFIEEISMSRRDLVDEYVTAVLTPEDRRRFEAHFLSTPQHFQMVEIARALDKRLERQSHDTFDIQRSPAKPFYVKHLKLVTSVTFGAVLLTAIYIIWNVTSQKGGGNEIKGPEEQRAILQDELARINRPAANSGQTAVAVVPLRLRPILVRDLAENRSITIPANPSVIELRLELPADNDRIYRASLQTNEGVELAVVDKLVSHTSSEGKIVVLNLPSSLMRPGSYQVKLTGALPSSEYEDVSLYPFEITSK